jgi:pimeloyl-ACP methyl ester carboxylesterase
MPRIPSRAPLHPSIPAADGVILRGELVYPAGNPGGSCPLAVLAHQYPATRDSFSPLCADLHAAGVATLAFDMRGHGESIWSAMGAKVASTPAEPTMDAFGAAFMASAANTGFAHIADDIVRVVSWGLAQNHIDPSRLILVGASVGGTGVLLAANRVSAMLRGVITFGAAGAGVHSADAMQRIRANCESVRVPMLMTTSEQDPFDAAANTHTWSKGLAHVKTKVVPGKDHAMAIYFVVRSEVLAFVRGVLAPGRAGRRTRAAAAPAGPRGRRQAARTLPRK